MSSASVGLSKWTPYISINIPYLLTHLYIAIMTLMVDVYGMRFFQIDSVRHLWSTRIYRRRKMRVAIVHFGLLSFVQCQVVPLMPTTFAGASDNWQLTRNTKTKTNEIPTKYRKRLVECWCSTIYFIAASSLSITISRVRNLYFCVNRKIMRAPVSHHVRIFNWIGNFLVGTFFSRIRLNVEMKCT